MHVSLVVATYGRRSEVENLLRSLLQQDYPRKNFETILVDQNVEIDLAPIVRRYENELTIKHLKSPIRSASVSRNIGIDHSEGEIIGFPDDDCTYYPDTISSAAKYFRCNPGVELVTGRLFDRQRGKTIYRRWPLQAKSLNRWNALFLYSAVTMFSRVKLARFDCRLGPGSLFPAYEDADYVYSAVASGHSVVYTPTIEVWHPPATPKDVSDEKVLEYGLGFLPIFIGIVLFHSLRAIIEVCRGDRIAARRRLLSATSRVKGYLGFNRVGSDEHSNLN